MDSINMHLGIIKSADGQTATAAAGGAHRLFSLFSFVPSLPSTLFTTSKHTLVIISVGVLKHTHTIAARCYVCVCVCVSSQAALLAFSHSHCHCQDTDTEQKTQTEHYNWGTNGNLFSGTGSSSSSTQTLALGYYHFGFKNYFFLTSESTRFFLSILDVFFYFLTKCCRLLLSPSQYLVSADTAFTLKCV